eukprot:CAMPEP_0197662854 /NCGR_PEP_ID=MMETSP1338-20131121/55087_1 /TAXON_ID=43686 ORGANISM="Pelagodinium beii, Strain RCC1491" /NCGR_SAMPLE_ID=MMETSP1338 /ASSEMBLY_ACC=CAM_ASM_000754 /LENGTH=249 /DNA_ID=CAMNT_0043240917 /DNA_START=313 /DNA_END=1062 /DNA_ORIENTATION=+
MLGLRPGTRSKEKKDLIQWMEDRQIPASQLENALLQVQAEGERKNKKRERKKRSRSKAAGDSESSEKSASASRKKEAKRSRRILQKEASLRQRTRRDKRDWGWLAEAFYAERRSDAQSGNGRSQSRRRNEHRSNSVREDDFEDYWEPSSSWSSGSWGYSTQSGSYAASVLSNMTAEEAMVKALEDGWKTEDLSRAQAISLLGLSDQCSDEEVSKVKRQMLLRWHPDRNPGDVNAGDALQLVLAAAGKLI